MANLDIKGKVYPPFEFPVERGKIREFALASRDDNPIYRDPEYAKASLAGGILAPPLFSRILLYEGTQVHADLGFDWRNVLLGGLEFDYLKPIRAGDTLMGHMRVADLYQKEGRRGGTMTFAVIEITYRNQKGEAVLVSRRTLIETQPRPAEVPGMPASRARRSPCFEEIEVGDQAPALVVGPVTRTDFVKFAGASMDFNPNHHDELHAIRSGYDRIFAMGPLSGAYLGRLLTDWLGDTALRRFGIRFMAQLWPGDVLTCKGVVTKKYEANGEGLVDCEAFAENQRGERVVEGKATAALPQRGDAQRKGGEA